MTAPANRRLMAVYDGFKIGSNGSETSSYFIDASRRPIVLERRDGKFRFACDVVIADGTFSGGNESSFASTCAALEAAFDSSARNGSLRIESSGVGFTHGNYDRLGGGTGRIEIYTSLNAKVFTLTINGSTVATLTAGTSFAVGSSNLAFAQNLAAAINASSVGSYVYASAAGLNTSALTFAYVWIQTKRNAYSFTFTSNASPFAFVGPSSAASVTGFNAVPSISKIGSEDDTLRSRRYAIEIVLDLPHTETGRNGLKDSLVQVLATDSGRQRLLLSGTFTALTTKSALEQYEASVSTYATTLQQALGGSWEGPFDVVARTNDSYAVPTDGTRKIGTILTFSRAYEELIYNRSLADDVRLKRNSLKVKVATPAPGDYGPNGKAVFRMRSARVRYDASVDWTASGGTDLKTIYETVVRPFLESEAKKALGISSVARVADDADLDRRENRVTCEIEYLAAQGSLLESTVTTQDEEDAGVQLVAVWDGDPFSKQRYDGPKTLRRTITQTFLVLSGAAAAAGGSGSAEGFGILARNQPQAFYVITERSAREAAIDSFFGIGVAGPGGGDASGRGSDHEPGFSSSGGVPDHDGFTPVFRNGVITIKPLVLGRPGTPQLSLTLITKVKVYEYIHEPKLPDPPKKKDRTPSPGAGGGGKSGGGKSGGDTVDKAGSPDL